MLRFWKRVHRQAWVETREYVRTRLGYAVWSVTILLIVVIAVRFYGTDGGWQDDLVGALIWIGALILAYAVIYVRKVGSVVPHLYARMATKWRDAEAAKTALLERPARRDISVGEAIAYLCFGSWGKSFHDAAASPEVSGSWEYNQFQQAAADGEVRIWGRLSANRVYEPIAKEFWRDNNIEWFSLLNADDHTEPIGRVDTRGPVHRYSSLMTSRADAERLFKGQPPALVRAKSGWRKLSNLFDEGATERNSILGVLDDQEAERRQAKLTDWDNRVMAQLDEIEVKEADLSSFRTLDIFEPSLVGDPERNAWQLRLEAIWNEKLRVLRRAMNKMDK